MAPVPVRVAVIPVGSVQRVAETIFSWNVTTYVFVIPIFAVQRLSCDVRIVPLSLILVILGFLVSISVRLTVTGILPAAFERFAAHESVAASTLGRGVTASVQVPSGFLVAVHVAFVPFRVMLIASTFPDAHIAKRTFATDCVVFHTRTVMLLAEGT